jgi:DNA-binding HxlR family transcriptional regulator
MPHEQPPFCPDVSGAALPAFPKDCPSRSVLETLAEKWTLLIMQALASGPRRTNELRRMLEGVSDKMLIQTLRRLERAGFVERRAYAEVPPRVDYQLTPLGHSLGVTLVPLVNWIGQHMGDVQKAQARFDNR